MTVIHNIPTNLPAACIATIGFFDGVHTGHKFLIEQVKEEAKARGASSAVVTFPVQPRKVIAPDCICEMLTTFDEKMELLATTGIDYCFVLDFTLEISNLSAYDFMKRILKERYNISGLVIGYDNRFGHNRRQGIMDYCRFGQELGLSIIRARVFLCNHTTVSSSAIRDYLHDHNPREANTMLGYPYSLTGKVVEGHKIGRSLGFPTANLRLDNTDKLIPCDGVYAVWVKTGNNRYAGMLSIGTRPTLNNGTDRSIEVNILHFNADIYGHEITLSLVDYIRPEIKYDTLQELIVQMHKDARWVESLLLKE